MDSKQAIFKTILGEMMKVEHENLSPAEVVQVALGAVSSFANMNSVYFGGKTQKEAIQNIVDTLGFAGAKVLFVSLWLEDINWHSENAKFCEEMKFWLKEIEQPGLTDLQKHSINSAKECVRGMTYIYGWGTNPADWESKGVGDAFVKELVEVIKNPKNI